jgi:hypothetical protein
MEDNYGVPHRQKSSQHFTADRFSATGDHGGFCATGRRCKQIDVYDDVDAPAGGMAATIGCSTADVHRCRAARQAFQ